MTPAQATAHASLPANVSRALADFAGAARDVAHAALAELLHDATVAERLADQRVTPHGLAHEDARLRSLAERVEQSLASIGPK